MTCESYRILASACRDGELETGEIIELGDHLKNCGECRTLFDNYTGIDDQLAELSVPTEDLKKETELARTDLLKHYRAARPRTSFIQRLVSRFTVPPPFAYATAAAIIIILLANVMVWRNMEKKLDRKLAVAALDSKIELLTSLVGRAAGGGGFENISSRTSAAGWTPFSRTESGGSTPVKTFDDIFDALNESAWKKVFTDLDTMRKRDAGLVGGDLI